MTGPRSFVHRLRPLVLCYHAVSTAWDDDMAVLPEAFQEQVRSALRAGYVPAPLGKTVAATDKILHVTFDDAFRSIRSSLAFLLDVGVPATVFACSDLADTGAALPIFGPGGAREAPDDHAATMTWDELREWATRGVEIGSHTCSHPRLTELSDAELRRELAESKERITGELARETRYLAYPFGAHDARVRAAAQAAGYDGSFAQASSLLRADRNAVYRVSIYRGDSLQRFSLKMSTAGRVAGEIRCFAR